MEWIICPAPGCGKKIKNLKLHYRASHPDLDVPDMRNPGPAPKPEQPKEQAQEPIAQPHQEPTSETPSDFLQKLKGFGISPNDVMAALGPLVETSVVQTLEKMQLGENINKKMADVEARLGEKIQPLVKLAEQLQAGQGGQPSGTGGPYPAPAQGDALRDQVLPLLLQKFLNPKSDSGGSLEQIAKTLELASYVANVVMKPYVKGQQDTMRQLTDLLKLSAGLGLTPEQRQGVIGGLANQGASGQ